MADGTGAALELLRLLAEDAPMHVLEPRARELVDAGTDDEAGAARELAVRLRAAIDARQGREAGLTALVDTAGELASRTDPGAVLDAIVRRARALLGTDVAYLTLYDPEAGDTYMRATDGSVSDRFQRLRLPLGAGLGGLVAQTRTPHWTADYPGDRRYRHTSEIDAAVGDEGLVAICGTPLLVEGEFVGVLFASNRRARAFTPEEISLLGSLAALAAVSLKQTRRAAETSRALAALSAAHAGIEQAAAAHDRFAAVVLEGGGENDVAAALGELLGCWVVVLDAAGRRTAAHGPAPDDPGTGAAAVRASAGTGRLASADGVWAVAVNAGDQRLGALVLGGIDDLDAAGGRTVERAAVVTALVQLFRLRAAEADQRVRTDLLTDLLADRTPAGALLERGRLLGLDLDAPHVVAVCRADGPAPRGLVMAAAAAAGPGLVGEHHGTVVTLTPAAGDPAAVAAALADRLGATVGAAGPVRPAQGLAEAHAEARRTADALLALGLAGRGASAAELGFAGLVVAGRPDVGGFLDRTLGPVVEHDRRRGADLLGTLEAYFAAGSSPTAAAARLHVHVNTVAQRLERVARLLGEDWQQPDRALDLQLALRLRRLTGG